MNLLDLKEKVTASSLQAPNGSDGEIVPVPCKISTQIKS